MINEVIETLKAYTDGKDNAGKVEISVMQLNRIIKALEQQPTDAVSRQAVLDLVADYDLSMGQVVKGIHALPPVTPQPKMGKWIKYGVPRCGEQHYKCTACGYYVNFGQWGELYTREFKYCPNCGVKMQEVENGTNN